jgi:hypothetical protein
MGSAQAAAPGDAAGPALNSPTVLKGNSTPLSNLPVLGGILDGSTRQSGLPGL